MASPPITISSSNDIITIISSGDDDSESMRVPVSEERLDKSSDRICNEKVNNWLTDPRNSHLQYSPDTLNILRMHDYCIRNEEITCNEEKNNTLVVKCDFENNTSVVMNDSPLRMKQTNSPVKNSTKTSVSLEALIGKALGNIFKRTDKEKSIISGDKNVKRKFKIRNICFKYNSPSKLLNEENKSAPMSPESQKKKELCTYLKLMNPADKKENLHVVKSRRCSTRVKRALERKHPTMQSFKDLNINVKKTNLLTYKKEFQFPPPPKRFLDTIEDFDDVVHEFIKRPETPKRNNNIKKVVNLIRRDKILLNRSKMKAHKQNWKKKYELRHRKLQIRRNVDKKRELVKNRLMLNVGNIRTLRSRRNLKNITMKNILSRNKVVKKKMKPKNKLPNIEEQEEPTEEMEKLSIHNESTEQIEKSINNEHTEEMESNNNCEIISVAEMDEDMCNLNDELTKLDDLTEENKRVLVENCILPTKTPAFDFSTGKMSPMFGFSSNDVKNVQDICDLYKKYYKSDEENVETNENVERIEAADSTVMEFSANILDHDYLNPIDDDEDSDDDDSIEEDENKYIIPKMTYEEFDPPSETTTILENPTSFQPFNGDNVIIKSLHRNLMQSKRTPKTNYWNGLNKKNEQTISSTNSHSIYINRENGPVLNAFYIENNLIICQEHGVSFWEQSALGNILNAQNMWLPKGHIQRLVFNNKYVQKKSKEMIISMETSIALVELWTKEHKSELRERPVADVFATVYFWKHRQTGLDKKVIQLENIKGFVEDVQYIVSRHSPKIIVSWNSSHENKSDKRTHIHAYQLASDYQTVANIYEIQSVKHYISSLHNIEDCNFLIMGCGESKITIWNIDYGNILASIDMSTIESPLATLWVKSDRGFLFTLQECENNELRLIAINGLNHSWKRLATYNPPTEFNRLKGVYFDEGILVSFYDKDILCWNVENSELIVQETFNGTEIIPSGKYVIMINNNQVIVRNTITYLYIE